MLKRCNFLTSGCRYGHDLAVRCVDMSEDFDIVVSGSDDGTIICHDLKVRLGTASLLASLPRPIFIARTDTANDVS